MEANLNIKPLSINEAYTGRRFKTESYRKYSKLVSLMLPKKKLEEPPYKIEFEFGFSNVCSDVDNPIKLIQDILQKKYGFNDKDVFEINAKKVIVKKGKEYIKLKVSKL